VIGGRGARDPLESEGVEAVADAVRALTLNCDRIGEDLLVSARIKEW
jgi:diaminohydroxyphosphoribosylaminopyrimidine deaminase/5-amino-6-(5-phosphoribosylamino)uracil reductase